MMKTMQITNLSTVIYQSSQWERKPSAVIGEQPVSLTVNNEIWLTFMCTPSDLKALAVGFLYNEEIIQTLDEVASVRECDHGSNIDVWLTHAVKKPENWIKTSGCSGGETSLRKDRLPESQPRPKNGWMLPAQKVGELVVLLGRVQNLYKISGGVHTSALSDGEKILIVAEDIGRHNTLDKLAGRCMLEQLNPTRRILLTTGRISSEMIQKAGRMRASVVISRTSPSSLSVQMAEELGITLIGYAKRERFTIYSHAGRILLPAVGEKVDSEVV
jgi:FdhD protein